MFIFKIKNKIYLYIYINIIYINIKLFNIILFLIILKII